MISQKKHTLYQWFSTGADFVPPGDICQCHNWGLATGIKWVEARDANKHPTMHRTVPTATKNYPVQNVNSAEAEKLCSILIDFID